MHMHESFSATLVCRFKWFLNSRYTREMGVEKGEIFFEALGCNVSIEIVQSLYLCKVNCEVDTGFSGTGFSEPHNSDL